MDLESYSEFIKDFNSQEQAEVVRYSSQDTALH